MTAIVAEVLPRWLPDNAAGLVGVNVERPQRASARTN